MANPFRVQRFFLMTYPGLSLRSNPGLKLANAFGVIQTARVDSNVRRKFNYRRKFKLPA